MTIRVNRKFKNGKISHPEYFDENNPDLACYDRYYQEVISLTKKSK